MQYVYLGSTGMKVSELCLGTITFGRELTEASDAHAQLNAFAEAGGNFIDTASVYGGGQSEAMIGDWLKTQPREAWVVATKVFGPVGAGPNDVGLSRKHIIASVETSLRRLQTDYLDLLQLHTYDAGTPLAETMNTLNALVQSGKVRYLGASNFTGWQLQHANDTARANGWEPLTSLQPWYNLLHRDVEFDLLQVCQHEGVGMIPYSPLEGGWLTGKYRRGMTQPPANTRTADESLQLPGFDSWANHNHERTWAIVDVLLDVAAHTGKTPAQVALNWLLHRPGVTAPILGARTLAHLQDNLGAVGWQLDADQAARLEEVSRPAMPYPHNVLQLAIAFRSRTQAL